MRKRSSGLASVPEGKKNKTFRIKNLENIRELERKRNKRIEKVLKPRYNQGRENTDGAAQAVSGGGTETDGTNSQRKRAQRQTCAHGSAPVRLPSQQPPGGGRSATPPPETERGPGFFT